MTIASISGQPFAPFERRRANTPGPQSSSRRPGPSSKYPDWAPPGFGQAGEQPTTVRFIDTTVVFPLPDVLSERDLPYYTPQCGRNDTCRHRETGARRARPGRED